MRIKILHTLFVLLFALFGTQVYAKQLDVKHWQNKNGVSVYFLRAPELPMLDIRVLFPAGSLYDGKQFGLASFTAAMLNQGTKDLSADQIADGFDQLGASYAATATRDMGVVSLRTLTTSKYLQPAVKLLSQVINSPQFNDTDFKRMQKQIEISIQQSQQFPSQVASDNFMEQLYGNFPYAHPVIGTTKSIKALTPQDLKSFYQKYYVANRADIVLVGNITQQQAAQIANQLTASLAQAKAPLPTFQDATVATAMKTKNISFPAQQTTILIGQVGINFKDPNYFPLMVGNFILGGNGLSSVLANVVRQQNGLAYGIGSDLEMLRYKGPFLISLQTRTDKAADAMSLAYDTARKFIAKGPTAKQLAMAKANIINGYPLTLDSNSKLATTLSLVAFYHLPGNFIKDYTNHVKHVTLADVTKAMQDTLHPDQFSIVTVGQS